MTTLRDDWGFKINEKKTLKSKKHRSFKQLTLGEYKNELTKI